MSHVRQQIRDRVVTTLTGLTTTGARVYGSRLIPYGPSQLPSLSIYTDAEEVADFAVLGGAMDDNVTVTIEVKIEARVKATGDIDDTMDTIQKEVQVAMIADELLNALSKRTNFQSVANELSDEGDEPIGVRTITYTVIAEYALSDPETAL